MDSVKDYIIQGCIGKGNFGRVYKASKRSGEIFAIKRISLYSIDQKLQHHLENEISILKQISHPSIISFKEIIKTPQYLYIVTEYLEGGTLETVLESNKIPPHVIKNWAKQLIGALKYLNALNIVHRDLKPANILLSSSNLETCALKICDFGFAKVLGDQLTCTKLGTPLYMAPEIFCSASYDYKVDVWSLGVIIYELATGSNPFNCKNYIQLIEQQRREVEFPENTEEWVKEIVRKMICYRVDKRSGWGEIDLEERAGQVLLEDSEECGIVDRELLKIEEETKETRTEKNKLFENNAETQDLFEEQKGDIRNRVLESNAGTRNLFEEQKGNIRSSYLVEGTAETRDLYEEQKGKIENYYLVEDNTESRSLNEKSKEIIKQEKIEENELKMERKQRIDIIIRKLESTIAEVVFLLEEYSEKKHLNYILNTFYRQCYRRIEKIISDFKQDFFSEIDDELEQKLITARTEIRRVDNYVEKSTENEKGNSENLQTTILDLALYHYKIGDMQRAKIISEVGYSLYPQIDPIRHLYYRLQNL